MGLQNKARFVKRVLFLWVCLLLGAQVSAKDSKPCEYLKYVKEIVDAFAKDMSKEHDLFCCGSGGSMPYDVQEIEVLFVAYRRATIEEVRKTEVDGIQKLFNRINTHEKIRPFLREYPFSTDRIRMAISFEDRNGKWYLDGTVARVSFIKNKIFYDAAALKKETYYPIKDASDLRHIVYGPPEERMDEQLVDLYEEPYEEAVKIVKAAQK